jgi:hypothetical protein
MSDDLDLQRLAEIPDPFAEEAKVSAARARPALTAYSPPRSRVQAMRALGAAAAFLYAASWPFFRRRPDLGSIPASQLALQLGVPLAIALIAASVVSRYGRPWFGERRGFILALVALSPVLFALATVVTLPEGHVDRFWRHTLACMLTTAILAAGPLAVAAYAFRHAFATLAAWRTAALGIACGALATAALALACPISNMWHVLVGHGAVLLLAGAVGAVLGQRICRA